MMFSVGQFAIGCVASMLIGMLLERLGHVLEKPGKQPPKKDSAGNKL